MRRRIPREILRTKNFLEQAFLKNQGREAEIRRSKSRRTLKHDAVVAVPGGEAGMESSRSISTQGIQMPGVP